MRARFVLPNVAAQGVVDRRLRGFPPDIFRGPALLGRLDAGRRNAPGAGFQLLTEEAVSQAIGARAVALVVPRPRGCGRPRRGRSARTARCGCQRASGEVPRQTEDAARCLRDDSVGAAKVLVEQGRSFGLANSAALGAVKWLCDPSRRMISLTRGNQVGSMARSAASGRPSGNHTPLPYSEAPCSAARTEARANSANTPFRPASAAPAAGWR